MKLDYWQIVALRKKHAEVGVLRVGKKSIGCLAEQKLMNWLDEMIGFGRPNALSDAYFDLPEADQIDAQRQSLVDELNSHGVRTEVIEAVLKMCKGLSPIEHQDLFGLNLETYT